MFGSGSEAGEDEGECRVRKLIFQLAVWLVEEKETVTVEGKPGGDGVILVLTVAAADLGRVIGKHGRTVRALRTVVQAASRELGQVYVLEVAAASEPLCEQGEDHSRPGRHAPNDASRWIE